MVIFLREAIFELSSQIRIFVYLYHLAVVLSFSFFFLSFSSSSSLSSAGVAVPVTRGCSSSSCFKKIFVSIGEIFDITIFFFMSIAELQFYPLLISATARALRLYEKLNGNNLCFRSHSSGGHIMDYYNNNRIFCHC